MTGAVYVAVLVVDRATTDHCNAVLLLKKRPDWQKGKLNLPGGHVEDGETPREAGARELLEECRLKVAPADLVEVCTLNRKFGKVHFFAAVLPNSPLQASDGGDEQVQVWVLEKNGTIPPEAPVVPNLRWVVPMAVQRLTLSVPEGPFEIEERE